MSMAVELVVALAEVVLGLLLLVVLTKLHLKKIELVVVFLQLVLLPRLFYKKQTRLNLQC